MARRLILVRHALSAVDPDTDSTLWGLAPGAEAEAERLAYQLPDDIGDTIWTSSETKAVETARTIADAREVKLAIDDRFGEVTRPWSDGDYRLAATQYLSGRAWDGWERAGDVVRRFADGVSDLVGEPSVIVDHGLALTLFLASVSSIDPCAFWAKLTFPDAWSIDRDGGEPVHLYNTRDSNGPAPSQ